MGEAETVSGTTILFDLTYKYYRSTVLNKALAKARITLKKCVAPGTIHSGYLCSSVVWPPLLAAGGCPDLYLLDTGLGVVLLFLTCCSQLHCVVFLAGVASVVGVLAVNRWVDGWSESVADIILPMHN